MAFSNAIGEFSLNINSATFSESLEEGTKINVEGQAPNLGEVVGTMTLRAFGPGSEGGKADWVGVTMNQEGKSTPTTGRGYYHQSGPKTWRLHLISQGANGEVVLVEGEMGREPRRYNGVVYKWK
ncbi:hypothetical protein [Halioxenophilus sp. WMMB6]|uniref:hypothetical protein n=1 Tax=Halioxenophilus sp. WMMB6 TaxID=3073815 RepID=UPI00295E22E2|nr:hypothetical protein [Halioxenophilus sp. WMMB6]